MVEVFALNFVEMVSFSSNFTQLLHLADRIFLENFLSYRVLVEELCKAIPFDAVEDYIFALLLIRFRLE